MVCNAQQYYIGKLILFERETMNEHENESQPDKISTKICSDTQRTTQTCIRITICYKILLENSVSARNKKPIVVIYAWLKIDLWNWGLVGCLRANFYSKVVILESFKKLAAF